MLEYIEKTTLVDEVHIHILVIQFSFPSHVPYEKKIGVRADVLDTANTKAQIFLCICSPFLIAPRLKEIVNLFLWKLRCDQFKNYLLMSFNVILSLIPVVFLITILL